MKSNFDFRQLFRYIVTWTKPLKGALQPSPSLLTVSTFFQDKHLKNELEGKLQADIIIQVRND